MENEKKEITLNELMPNEFYPTKEGIIKCELTLDQVSKIVGILTDLQTRIDKAVKYCEESSKTIKSEYFSDVLKILKGETE